MRLYDAECPVCGTKNHGLFLEETEGWMECQACRSIVNVKRDAVPCPPFETGELATRKEGRWYIATDSGNRKEQVAC